jgi:hypothetical protein
MTKPALYLEYHSPDDGWSRSQLLGLILGPLGQASIPRNAAYRVSLDGEHWVHLESTDRRTYTYFELHMIAAGALP